LKNCSADAREAYENTKRVALLEFAELPRSTPQPLELALDLRTEKDDLERRGFTFSSAGWAIGRRRRSGRNRFGGKTIDRRRRRSRG